MRGYCPNKGFLITGLLAAIAALGCNGIDRGGRICPAIPDVSDAISLLTGNYDGLSFQATGSCVWEGIAANGKKSKEAFAVRIWFVLPDRFCMHGDVLFNSRGLVVGINPQEFWLVAKPKEIRSYLWGNRQTAGDCSGRTPIPVNPGDLFEAMGVINFEQPGIEWRLEADSGRRDNCDILTAYNADGDCIRKLYIDRCDYLVRQIEYFDVSGRVCATGRLGDYQYVKQYKALPRRIELITGIDGTGQDKLKIKLKSLVRRELTEKQSKFLFSRPSSDDFEKIFVLSDGCEWLEQPKK